MQLLCSTDDSIAGAAALRVAVELADRLRDALAGRAAGDSDPAPQLLRTARAAGCDRIAVGVVREREVSRGPVPAGWQHRIVRCAPSPAILLPAGATLPHGGGVVLAEDGDLPSQAARVAGRLAASLRAPLVITHLLSATGRPLSRRAEEPTGGAHRVTGLMIVWPGRPVAIAAADEAALVVIAGRGPGRSLLPRRRAARALLADARR